MEISQGIKNLYFDVLPNKQLNVTRFFLTNNIGETISRAETKLILLRLNAPLAIENNIAKFYENI